jgi:polysaccharide biosynthesis protein VpsQ
LYRHTSPQPPPASSGAIRWLPWTVFLTYASFILSVLWVMDTGRGQLVRAFVEAHAYSDKLAHCVLMGTLCLLLNIALAAPTVRILNRPVLRGSLWLGAVVVLEELSQLYVPHRTFDLVDLLFDFLGIAIAGAITRRLVEA